MAPIPKYRISMTQQEVIQLNSLLTVNFSAIPRDLQKLQFRLTEWLDKLGEGLVEPSYVASNIPSAPTKPAPSTPTSITREEEILKQMKELEEFTGHSLATPEQVNSLKASSNADDDLASPPNNPEEDSAL